MRQKDLHPYKGRMLSLSKISQLTGVGYGTLNARINRDGLSLEEAIEKPVVSRNSSPTNEWKQLSNKPRDSNLKYIGG